jgi:Plavaka transposase
MSASRFVCHNPDCGSRRQSFSNEKGYTMHFALSPSCLSFIDQSSSGGDTRHQPIGADDAVYVSTIRSSLIRRDVINPNIADMHNTQTWSASLLDDEATNTTDAPSDDDFAANDESYAWEVNATLPLVVDSNEEEPWLYTDDQKWTVALLKLLDDMNAPDYAFASVLRWARGANAARYSFYPDGGLSRSRSIDLLFSGMKNAKQFLPSVVNVTTPHGPPRDVIVFDFVPQLLRLLQNPKLMTADNLLIDPVNPLLPYASPQGELGDAISGQVYRDAYKRMITNPERQLFVPIIQWIDRTSVTGNDRFSLKPYMFTPAIFKEPFRRKIQAWGYHGFLPKQKTSSAQNQTQIQGNNIRNYHAELYAVLNSFTTSEPRLRNVILPLGPNGAICVDIITCILFVIQDMQEGDALCGRYGSHTTGIQRHCRACNVTAEELDNPHAQCSFLIASDMARISHNPDQKVRTPWSQHYLNNAFDYVPMADPVRGIFGATPVETLHAFRKGLIEKVTFLVLKNVPARRRAALDALAVHFHRKHRQTYRKIYPATDFSNGITNLTKISAAERVGLVFLFVILAQYDEGWIILSKALQQKTRTSLRKIINVFEALLCFDQWLNKPTYWNAEHHDESILQVSDAITKLMEMCKKDIPLFKKKTWKFPKFHELKHILNDMERFGAPINYCAQRPESLLIPVAKQPGRRAQKRHTGALYELQAAQRLSYSLMIAEVHSRIWGDVNTAVSVTSAEDHASIFESTGNATFGVLFRDNNMMLNVHWTTKTNVQLMHLPTPLMEFMWTTFGPHVRFCTEYVRDQFTFRCHPAYQSDNPINDWMNVLFEVFDTKTNTYSTTAFPCRLAAVVIRAVDALNPDPYHLVVQSTTKKTGIQSVLLTEWCWSSEYLVILPSNIVGPCFVISIKPDMSKVLEALPLEKWASEFTKPVDDSSSSSDDDDNKDMHTDMNEETLSDSDDDIDDIDSNNNDEREEEEEEEDGDY